MFDDQKKHEILDLAVEDWTPLFDVTNAVSPCFPNKSFDEQIEVARSFVRHLLSKGYVKLVYECQVGKSFKRQFRDLTSDDAKAEMEDQSNWIFHEPRGDDNALVCIVATPEGENAVYRCKW